MFQVRKRDGKTADFDINKISAVITKAFDSVGKNVHPTITDMLSLKVAADFDSKIKDGMVDVEDIQDSVEKVLSQSGYSDVAKEYILYRKQRERMRNTKSTLLDYKETMNQYLNLADWRVKENSTVSYSIGGLILSNSGAMTANYWLSEVYDDEIGNAHRNADIHIHDLSMLSGYCAGWSLKQLIQEGLGGVPGKISSAPASHLSTLCNQMVNFLGILQNEWAGAQAFSSFDTYLAPFVKVDNLSYKEVKQALQSFIFGVNTPSRWGCVDEDTEVLSVDGFKKYNELKENDLIYTWNNGRLELNAVRHVIKKQYSGYLHSYTGRGYNQTITPNHRMLVKEHNRDEYKIMISDDVFNEQNARYLPVQFFGSSVSDAAITDDEIKLAAMLYTDGSFDFRNNSIHKVCLYKSPRRIGHDEIPKICDRIGLKYSHKITEGQFGSVSVFSFYGDSARKIVSLVGSKKQIAKKFLHLSQRQARLFLETWASFDGDENKMKLQFDNDGICDQLQQIAINAGACSYVCRSDKANYVKIRKVSNVAPTNREKVEYDGIVWCPNVENGTAVFRKNGCVYISGQTQAPFSNITLDWVVPNDLAELNAIVGGKEMDFKYKDCQKEMDMVNKAFIEIMIEGDANGRGFQYPINFVA